MLPTFPTPHLFGEVTYRDRHNFRPDGDTIHLRNPLLVDAAGSHEPRDGKLRVWMPGLKRPVILKIKQSKNHLTIRLSGLDTPEEHYAATPFTLDGKEYWLNNAIKHEQRAQPLWKPATEFLVNRLEQTHWALIELDRDVVDVHQRVLGYVYESDKGASKGVSLSLELVKRGLAFPFVFESAGDHMVDFLGAAQAARRKKLGVWKHYQDKPLPYSRSFEVPKSFTDPEPAGQAKASLNLPVVFRRVVDSAQLEGLSLKIALQKYDCIDSRSGKTVTGDEFQKIPIDNRVWRAHRPLTNR
jgi:endonuclease YncB( thermonuclease family)